MKKVNNSIYKALSRIPPIFSKTTLRIVERDLKTFFRSPNRRYKYFLPPSFTYFSPEPENDFELSIEDQNQLESILSLNGVQAIIVLSKNPLLCHAACLSTNVVSFIEFYSKDIFNEFVALALFGQSVDLLNYILFRVNPPKPPLWPKPRFSKAIPWLLGASDMPLFAPIKLKKFLTIPSPIYKLNEKNKKSKNNSERPLSLSNPSSFTASHTQIFIGLNNGTIIVEPYPPKNEYSQSYTINVSSILNDRLYSLVWALDSLWIFTETNCFCIDTLTSSLSSLKSNASGLFPVFSDGFYFYSMTNTNRIVTVFTINRGQLKIVRKVRLEKPIDRFTPFITNGIFFTFADIIENARIFVQFSAVNGSFIRDFKCDFQMTEFAFCISPYRQHHFVLTNYKLEVFSDNFQLPRWSLGLSFPESHLSDLTTVFNAVYYALYHDKKLFHDSRYDSILEMATNYVQLNDQYGVILSAMLLCHSRNRIPIEVFNQYFRSTKSEGRLFLCIVLLLCHSDKRSTDYNTECSVIKLPNIINSYIEEEYPPSFIWLFPKFFNFRRIEFSSKGIIRLITYVTGQSSIFPDESFFILSSFLRFAFANILNEPDKFISPINAITISIEQKVISMNDKKGVNDRYVKSTVDYKIWTELLLLIYQHRQKWIYFSSLFVKFFNFGLLNNRQYCGELNRMLNCTLYIFLSLFSNISLAIYPKFFNSLEEFFKEFSHPMNGVYISIDQKIFKLLSQCNDIPSKEEFTKYFFSLRNYFIFESPSISFATIPQAAMPSSSMFSNSPSQAFDKLLSTLQDKQYSIKGVIKYIFENDPRELIQLQNHSIIEWFVMLFETRQLNDCQQCIFSIFLETFEKIKPLLIEAVKAHSAYYFIKSFSYPFLFPPELFLNVPDVTCNVQEIIDYPLHLLRLSYKNIITCHSKIVDSTLIVLPLISRLLKDSDQDPVLLFDPSMEPVLYHDLILWMIGYKWGEIIDFRNYLFSFIVLLRNGSKREIRATMKWVYIAEYFNDFNIDSLFHEMLDIIGDYLLYSKNPFRSIKDPFDIAETVFTIVHYCKKLFNLQTAIFRNYLLKYIDENDKKTIIAAFAILNNSIDVLRRNTHVTILNENFILIKGKVREYKLIDETANTFRDSNCVYVENLDKKSIENVVLNKCVQMWATPKAVDLSLLFSNLSEQSQLCLKFQKIFMDVKFECNYQNTFKLAALNSFLNLKFFRDSLSDEFKRSLVILNDDEWPNYYMMDRSYLDFSYFLTVSHSSSPSRKIKNDSFYFCNDDECVITDELNDEIEEVSFDDFGICSNEQEEEESESNYHNENNCIIKGSQNLFALDKKVHFKSSPLHPRLHSKLSFTFDSPAFSVELYGLTDINEYILKYGPIIAATDKNASVQTDLDSESHYLLIIEVLPEKSMILITVSDYNNNKTKEINLLIPPLKMLYVSLDLESGTICSLTYEIDTKIVYFNEVDQNQFNSSSLTNYCSKNDSCIFDKMFIVKNEKVPLAPSSKNPGFFEFTSLEFSALNLNKTLKQMNAIQIMKFLPSSAILNLLFFSNPVISDKSLNFKKMISVPLWLTTSEKLRETVLKQITKEKLKEMENEIMKRRNTWPSVNIHNNQTFVFTKGDDEKTYNDRVYRRVHYSNCFIMNETRYIMLGLHDSKLHVYSGMVILPYLGINSTMLEIAINCRHLIACIRFLSLSEFDVAFFFSSLQLKDEKISQSISTFSSATDSSLSLSPTAQELQGSADNSASNSSASNALIITTPDYIDYIGYNFLKSRTIKSISIFGEIRGLAELIFPSIPKEGEKPDYKEESLLIPESAVHDYPDIFFFHKYFELVSPRYHQQVFSCNNSPMYLTTTTENAAFEVNNRSFKSNQFAILYNKTDQTSSSLHGITVQRSFKVKSEDKNATFIYDIVPNFSKIESEFRNWKSHHSFQLLLSINSAADVKMTYKKLPLSTKFSFEVTFFMFHLLKKHKTKLKEKIDHFESQINILVKPESNRSPRAVSSSSIIENQLQNQNQQQNQNKNSNSNPSINPYQNPYSNPSFNQQANIKQNSNAQPNTHLNQNQNQNIRPNTTSNQNQNIYPNAPSNQNQNIYPNAPSNQNQNVIHNVGQNQNVRPNTTSNQNQNVIHNVGQNQNIRPNTTSNQNQNQNIYPNAPSNQNQNLIHNVGQNQNIRPNTTSNQNQNIYPNTTSNQNQNVIHNAGQNQSQNIRPNTITNQNHNVGPNIDTNSNPNSHMNPHLNQNIFPHMNQNIYHIAPNMLPYANASANPNVNPYSSQNASISHAQYMQSLQASSQNTSSSQNLQLSSNPNSNSILYSNIQLSTTQNSSSTLASNLHLSSNQNLKPPLLSNQQQPIQNQNQVPLFVNPLIYQNSTPNMYSIATPEFYQNANNNGSPYLNTHPYSYSNLNVNSSSNQPFNTNFKSNINLNDNPVGTTYSQLKQFIEPSSSADNNDGSDNSTSSSSINLSLQQNPQADTFSTLTKYTPKNKNARFKQKDNTIKNAKNNSNEKLIPSIDINSKTKIITDSNNNINNKADFIYPINIKKKGENAKFVHKINSSFKFAQELGEFSVNSKERVDFLNGLRIPCTIFDRFDSHMVHIFTGFKESCKKVEDIKKDLSIFFRTQNMSPQSLSYLQKFVQTSPDFVVLLFIEFCTGESAISKWPIYVISVNNEGILRTSQEDHLLVIGKFQSYDAFSRKLLSLIQQSQDDLVV